MSERQAVYRKDYTPADYLISTVDLTVHLQPETTRVIAELQVTRREGAAADAPLRLHGEGLKLLALSIDGVACAESAYVVSDDALTIAKVPASFVLCSEVEINPQANLELSGLYRSNGVYCTQCEAEGFRRITYFLDRPDNMATFRCTVHGDKTSCPVLLANGNRVASGEGENDTHWATWEDPYPKPSYLFALVAGDLGLKTGTFTTKSGREVALEVYTEHRFLPQTDHAITSLQKSMAWDEEVFGLEYDLDIYMIVAVSDFNMGAMENKGLNVFNTKYVLAHPETATDTDYEHVEAVIAHEYFHNWTGNRVTCRDWFQLTLKEGLTVFRDQQFTADQTSHGVKRIDDVQVLRAGQFPEDAGPMSHPIRPESYIAMDNFYTATVYNKGAEVIRMYHTLLGADGFRKGMDLYFQRHDGQAVTCDDFRAAMADANDTDLTQFERWYTQNGTPKLNVSHSWNGAQQQLTLSLEQTPFSAEQQPFHMPIRIALFSTDGAALPSTLNGQSQHEHIIELTTTQADVILSSIDSANEPVVSVLRNFSAPVTVMYDRSDTDLALLCAHDDDAFNRWEASQELGRRVLQQAIDDYQNDQPICVPVYYVDALKSILRDDALDGSMKAKALALPSERELGLAMTPLLPDVIHAAREAVRKEIAEALYDDCSEIYQQHVAATQGGEYRYEQADVCQRTIANVCLSWLCASERPEAIKLADEQFAAAKNMTDSQAALSCIVAHDGAHASAALEAFYDRWQDEPLVVDKWFALQASSSHATPEVVANLMGHPAYSRTNPNRFRSLTGIFAMANQYCFHATDGSGYRLVADEILAIQKQNPQLAARVVGAFNHWKRLDDERSQLMRKELERIQQADLSADVAEIVGNRPGLGFLILFGTTKRHKILKNRGCYLLCLLLGLSRVRMRI